ncbi:MAG: dihydrofolate reductase [Defluviitaleaceae bacterium]|nr:dihydrofolate reductase [Defluviitaleaceae bacterium]
MNLIVAVDLSWGIGIQGRQPFYIKKDLKRLRKLTMGKTVVMGRKTFEDIGKPLDGRRNIILSNNPNFQVDGAEVCGSVEEVLASLDGDAFILGGASVYTLFLRFCTKAYITKVQSQFEVDTYFENLDILDGWQEVEVSENMEEDGLIFKYITYERAY